MPLKTNIAPRLNLKNSGFFSSGSERPFFKPIIQPKLTVNAPKDVYEKEADATADEVMHMPDAPEQTIQSKCAGCEEEDKLQRQEESSGNRGPTADSPAAAAPEEGAADEGAVEGSAAGEELPNISIELPRPLTLRVNGVIYTSPTFLLEGPNGRILDIAPYTGTGAIDFPLAALESLGIPILSYYHFHFGRARQFLGQHFESAYGLSGGTSFIRNALHYGYITADDVTLFGAPSSYNLEHYGGIPHLNIVANPRDIGTMINVSYFNFPLEEGHNNPAIMFSINAPFDQNPFEAFSNLGGAIYHALSGDLYSLPNVTHNYPRFRNEPDTAIGSPVTMTQISRKAESQGNGINPGVEAELNKSRGTGNSLPSRALDFMESRFGADFNSVNIHTDRKAVQLSRKLNAQAFTYGTDIYFNEGRFAPDTSDGKRLLAHELTHVIQQDGIRDYSASPVQRTEEEGGTQEMSLDEELEFSRQALATIHTQMSTGLFDWGISEAEAHRVFEILRDQNPAVLLRSIQALRLTNRGRRFYEALSESDRQSFDEFALNFGIDTGFLASGDVIRIEVYASSRQTEAEFSLDLQVSSGGIQPHFLTSPVQVRNLSPQQAAGKIARIYREELIFVEPRVRILVIERGAYYAPRNGETTQSVWFEALERLSSEEAAMMAKRQQLLDYINLAGISDDPSIVDASLRYLGWISVHYNTPVFLERSPQDLWDWALEEAMQPPPQSPVQPFLDLYSRMSHRLETVSEEDRSVLAGTLSRYLDWIDQHIEDPNLNGMDPTEIWVSLYSRSFDYHLQALRETTYRRVTEERRQQEEEQTRAAREQRWEEYFSMAMRLWGYTSRNFPYVIPVPSEGRDILVTGDPARQAVLDALASELMSWSTDNMHAPEFLDRSVASVLVELLDRGYSEQLAEANLQPLQSESIDRHEIIGERALASFGETVAKGLLVIGLVGAAVGAGIVTAPVAAVLLIGAAGATGIMAYMERREEIEGQQYDVPIPESMLHAAGDVVGLSQLIEGITGERLGTGRRLDSMERSDQFGTGSAGVVLLLTGSKAYRSGQLRGQRLRFSRHGNTPPGPEGGVNPSPQDTPPVNLSMPSENPGPIESQVRNALDQGIRSGFDEWMAEIRNNGGNPEGVLGRMPVGRRVRTATRRAEDFTGQFLERLRQERIRIRSMDNPLNPVMRHVEQAVPGDDGVLILYNRQPPGAHEIQQAIRLHQRTGEPVRVFGDTASGQNYPGIDGTIGSVPRPLSLKHGAMEANPNFARFQAEEALISARNNGYTHVEVHIEMEGGTIAAIRNAWAAPPLRPGQAQPRPVFDSNGTIARIIIKGTDDVWVIEPPLEGLASPGIVIPVPEEENE